MKDREKEIISKQDEGKKSSFILEFLRKIGKRYFIIGMNGMALGLFASLIIGEIIKLLGRIPFLQFWQLDQIYIINGTYNATFLIMGAGIGVGVALALKHKNMVVISAAVAGVIGSIGGPLGAYIAVIIAVEVGALIAGKTKVDIILTPLVVILSAWSVTLLVASPINELMSFLGNAINSATQLNPVLMGIILAVSIGMILTSPLSSAAICISLNLSGIAAGAACVGCCVNMVGFATCSYKRNGIGGVLSIGLGTSMLQFANVMRKPITWLPVILASAILGPISAAVLKMSNTASGAGMGTSGFVGQFGAIEAMSEANLDAWSQIWQIGLMHFVGPILLVLGFYLLLKKIGWINDEDYLLNREAI